MQVGQTYVQLDYTQAQKNNQNFRRLLGRPGMITDLLNTFFLKKASCFEGSGGDPKRANTEELLEIFNKHATVHKNGELYMSSSDFVRGFLKLLQHDNYNEQSLQLLAGIVDTSKDGLISFSEFQAFEGLLCVPDALYRTAFQLFDISGKGMISYKEFIEVIGNTELNQRLSFDKDNTFMKLYFGKDKTREINYSEFSQFLHDQLQEQQLSSSIREAYRDLLHHAFDCAIKLKTNDFHEECGIQAFQKFDKNGTGFISALDFQDIMINIKNHLLTKEVQDNLVAAAGGGQAGHRVSFPYFMAFNSLLSNMELVKRIYLNATNGSRTQELTKDEFLYSAQMMSQITPLEVDILYLLCHLIHLRGRIVYNDLQSLAPEQYYKQLNNRLAEIIALATPDERSFLIQVLESTYRFTLGAVAGGVGATAVYPIDLVKTRMQNQRTGSFIGEVMYRNSWDCFRKVLRYEGPLGLYRGLLPQMMGVAPEKAIKLTVNDLVRDKLMDSNGNIKLYGEIISGGCAGCSQVIFSNPLEIVKIRLQVAGEIASGHKVRTLSVIKELGVFGLYKGVSACLLRDVLFSAIYFPTYAHMKTYLTDEEGYNSPITLFASAIVAGVPAASLVTPADVIKTRLQVVARKGQTTYTGVVDAARKILAEEGPRAFWKGAPARVFRSAPQFGFTLLTYELLQRLFYVDFGGTRPTGSEHKVKPKAVLFEMEKQHNPDHIGGYQAAIPILEGIETKFGLCLPKFRMATVNQPKGTGEDPKRANTEELLEIFNKHATVHKNGELYMSSSDFVRGFLKLLQHDNYNEQSLQLLAGIVDTSKDGLISFSEFQAFEGLLCVPDALYRTAFRLFDINGNGMISYKEFIEVIGNTELNQRLSFDKDNTFMKLYFGKDKTREINYLEFSQFLHDQLQEQQLSSSIREAYRDLLHHASDCAIKLKTVNCTFVGLALARYLDFHEECGIQAFQKFDKNGSGFISALDFQDIMINIKNHLLTKEVQDNLVAAAGGGQAGHRVSFPYFMAFNSLLSNMELVKRIYLNATNDSRTQELTKDEFLYSAQMMSQITPLEVDILYLLCHLIHLRGRIVYNDLQSLAPEQYYNELNNRLAEVVAFATPDERSFLIQVLESAYRFTLGAVAGGVGATAVYPIDLVKTRMQNQRFKSVTGEKMYRNSWDCFRKVLRNEGPRGLYRGLLPQVMGVSPEKAIKLTVNDFVRDKLTDSNGNIKLYNEIISGGCAGCSQVIFSNPIEIIKIRLQVAGEVGQKFRALSVIKELIKERGVVGLYKGVRACLLRDSSFAAIYFPTYSHMKANLADKEGYNSPITLFASAIVAGVPAASLVTPADVIKTRLQVVARKGQTTYTGVVDAARKIFAEEGPRAFWKGAPARVFRSAPQFGFTLLTYELLQRLFYVDFGGTRPSGSEHKVKPKAVLFEIEEQHNPDHIGGYEAAIPILEGIETQFGLCLPKFRMATVNQPKDVAWKTWFGKSVDRFPANFCRPHSEEGMNYF